MSTYTSNIKTSIYNDWVIKRMVTSAIHFFSEYGSHKAHMKRRIIAHSGELNCAEDVRNMFAIQPHVWAYFMDELFANGLVIREHNRAGLYYRNCRTDRPTIENPILNKYITQIAQTTDSDPAAAQEFPTPQPELSQASKEAMEKVNDMLNNQKRENGQLTKELEEAKEKLASADDKKVVELTIHDASKPDQAPVKVDSVHKNLPDLLVRIECGLNVFLVGPAGSGKTFAAEQVSETLGLEFGFMSVGPQTTKSDVFGFMNATGGYTSTEFRRRFEHGGVFLFDEIDAAHPGVLTQINAALAGSTCAFPDGMIKKHDTFRCIAAGNTFGTGPDRQYVGRQQMDAASIDRFDFVEWPYDEGLELHIARATVDGDEIADTWTSFIQSVRAAVQELGLRHVVSPRATINGVKLLAAGVPNDKVRQSTVWKSLKPDEVTRVLAKVAA